MFENEPDGATPVDADEAADLLPQHIGTRAELNAWEQQNIIEAVRWTQTTRKSALDPGMIRDLHGRMFDKTWEWAGKYRLTDKNIGVTSNQIAVQIQKLIDDAGYWVENETYTVDEIALRLHHRLVSIHPFPNGNGRHARLWCDLFLRENRRPVFDWKSSSLDEEGTARHKYIAALRKADRGNYDGLKRLLLVGRPR